MLCSEENSEKRVLERLGYCIGRYIYILDAACDLTEDTKKGILRDSVATFNLIGSETEFSTYSFVNEIEEYCMSKYNMNPRQIYPYIEKNGNKLSEYLSLSFLIKNFDRFSNAINNVEKDYKKGILNKERIQNYLKWKEEMEKQIVEEYYDKDQYNNTVLRKRKINNPLYEALYKNNNNVTTTIQSMVQQKCNCCDASVDYNYCWGFVSSCCGSYFCVNCVDSMTSNRVIMRENNKDEIVKDFTDLNNNYCIVCHKCNPRYFVNTCRHKRYNIHAYNIIEEYMQLRNKLVPYIYNESYIYHKYGVPLIQPLYYKYPKIYDEPLYKNQYFYIKI